MKLECQVEKIKDAILLCERVTGKNLTLPVLSSILLKAKDKTLTLISTNLSIGTEIKIQAKIEKEGTVALDGQTLASLFSAINKSGVVKIEQTENTIKIKTKNSNVNIKTVPHEDFPTLPNVVGEEFDIPADKFMDGIKSVYYSSALSDIKPEIGSVYIYKENQDLVFVATDSFRLAEKKIKMKSDFNFNSALIPHKNTIEILRLLDNQSKDDVNIVVNKNQISFTKPGLYITSRVVDGVFPDYVQIIPKETHTEVTILKQDLINALKVSNVFSDKFNQVVLDINPREKKFEIKSQNKDIGENNTLIDAAISGDKIEANFNYKYIIDTLQSISTDSLTLSLMGANKPMVIKPVGDRTFMALIMPMNH